MTPRTRIPKQSRNLGRILRSAAGAAALGLAVSGCGSEDQGSFELPGDEVFPEGIGVNKANGDVFVGSTNDGTIYRGSLTTATNNDPVRLEPFLAGGEDGRTAATGIKVDGEGRLWVAGRDTGRAFVYDATTGELIQALETPAADRTLINDLTFTPDAAFITDSFRPVIWRVERSNQRVGTEMEPWLDLTDTIIPTNAERGFGLNGITSTDDASVLLTVHFDTGRLFRIHIGDQEVTEVDLGEDLLTTGDGLLLEGRDLLVVREKPGGVYPVRLNADLTAGSVGEPFGENLLLPTTVAEYNREALVVNSQLNDQESPNLPFTVARIPVPDGVLD